MKKLLALFLALSMVVFSGISAFASGIDYGTWGGAEGGEPASAFFTLSGTNSAAKHESGKEFEIVLDVTDITLQEGGIQALEFRLAYDPALVTPVTKAGEEGNFDAVISGIENWEGFGRLDETAGEYYIAFGGNETAGKIDSTVSARFTFKFTSTAAAVGSDLTFRVTDIRGVDLAGNECSPAGFEITVADGNPKPLQPTPREELPADAKKIDYVGYKHEGGLTVLLAAKEATTIGALVRLGDAAGIGSEDPDMNYWAVMIIDAEGKVIGIYNKLGRPDGVKTDVAIPAGGAAIGVFGNKDAFANVNIGDSVRVYNITEECFNVTGHKAVTKAGYTVTPAPAKELTPKADAKLEVIDGKVRLYVDNVTIEAFKAMFDNEFTVLDSEGKEVTEGLVKTGMKIDFGEGFVITVLGDVDQNGIVNSTDYLYARRAYLGTLTLSDAQKDAADLGNDAMGNLILLKRHILGTQYIRELLTK